MAHVLRLGALQDLLAVSLDAVQPAQLLPAEPLAVVPQGTETPGAVSCLGARSVGHWSTVSLETIHSSERFSELRAAGLRGSYADPLVRGAASSREGFRFEHLADALPV